MAVVLGLAVAYGFAFTLIGEAGELIAAVALIALVVRGMTGAGRRVRQHHH